MKKYTITALTLSFLVIQAFAGTAIETTDLTEFQKYQTKIHKRGMRTTFIEKESAFNIEIDNPTVMLSGNGVRNIHIMDQMHKQSGGLAVTPWVSDYWATANGGIAHRYAVPEVVNLVNVYGYSYTYDYYARKAPTYNLIHNNKIDLLSPAEKYDLLMGDVNFTLTKEALSEGRRQFFGKDVPYWSGICHGWALAAIATEAPRKKITLQDVTGNYHITFYPHDIRALVSQYYSREETAFKTIGTGIDCRKYDAAGENVPAGSALVSTDQNNRVLDSECVDTNPGTLHTVLINKIGINKESFVMDKTFDAEIWNQPIHQYKLSYFNPVTNKKSFLAKEAMVHISQLSNDRFRAYRSPQAQYIVGVNLWLVYNKESRPDHKSYLSQKYDRGYSKGVTYRYDLELSANGDILGGEWHSKKHPDFLFMEDVHANKLTHFDHQIFGQNIQEIIKQGAPISREASRLYKAPLYKVVEKLIQLSK